MPTLDPFNIMQTQLHAPVNVSAPKAAPAAAPPVGPTGFWNRIGQVGVGKVNLLNAYRAATAAPSVALTTAARVLPGGQNDIKANQEAVKSSTKTQQNIEALRSSGKITSPQAAKLLKNNANNDNQTSEAAHADVKAGTVAEQSKQGVQMLEATPRAIVNTAEKAGNQFKYLAGPSNSQKAASAPKSTSQGLPVVKTDSGTPAKQPVLPSGDQIIKNQQAAAKNPEYIKATTGIKSSNIPANAKITAQQMAAKGAKAAEIRDYLDKQVAGLDKQTKQGFENAAQIASAYVGLEKGAGIVKRVTGQDEATKNFARSAGANKLLKTGEEANTKDSNVGKVAINAQQAAEAKVANVGKKAVTGRQITPEPSETKLLGPGTGKVTGKGFTASPSADAAKIKISARLNTINKKLNDVAQGKISMAAEDVKALKAEKDAIYKQAQTTPTEVPTEKSPSTPAQTRTGAAGQTRTATEVTPQEPTPTVTRPKSTPKAGPKVSGSVLKSESRAVEAGVTKELEDKAGYNPTSYKSDAENAVTMAHENPEKAMDIATGKVRGTSPSHEVAVRRAVETKALNEGDVDTLQKLASSSGHTATSEAAQRLGAEAYNADDHSPVTAMQHVVAARTKAMEKRVGSVPKETTKIVKEIASREKPISKQSWAVFVESIRC